MSRIIKLNVKPESGTAPEKVEESDEFLAWDHLWEGDSTSGVVVDPLVLLKKRREEVRRETEEMLRRAEQDVARIERAAYEKGYAQGHAQGEKEGMAAGRKKFDAGAQQFANLMKQVEKQRAEFHQRYEQDILLLLKTLVDRLTMQVGVFSAQVIQACVQASLTFVVDNTVVRIYLNPADFAMLQEAGPAVEALLAGKKRIDLLEDPGITAGGCRLETDFGDVDATLECRREQLIEVLDTLLIDQKG